MGGLPKKALLLSRLDIKTAGSAVADGSHQTYKASFIEDGRLLHGFYKKLAPKKDYPPLLAYISVAASLFKRLFQGSRSAEERLVFDDEGELVGTFSINVPNFRPFNISNETIPADPNIKELVIPSTKTLVEYNMMETLLGRWFLDDDDGHPHNMSLFGDIDFDMFFYWFTIYIKTARTGIGVPKTRVNLTVEDYENFPCVKDSKPFHWPTYKHPGQETIPSVLPLQGEILKTVLPKVYADPVQFENLAANPIAQEQKFAAALKVLLTFQPEMVRGKLVELFGDQPLNYTSLDSTDPALRATYEKEFPHLCNAETNSKPFIDFMLEMYQEHFDNFYRVVVFYMGCKQNNYGVPLPATSQALYHKPSYYEQIKKWVSAQNESNNDNSSFKYDLDELHKRYHQVWRDAFAPNLIALLQESHKLTNEVMLLITDKKDGIKLVGKTTTDATVTKSLELFGDIPMLSPDDANILADKDSQLRDSYLLLVEFTNKLTHEVKIYYEKERKDLTDEDNLTFAHNLTQLHADYNLKIRKQLANTTSHAKDFNRIAVNLMNFTVQVNLQLHLTTTDEQMKEMATTEIPKVKLPLDHEDTIRDFNVALFRWAKGLKPSVLENYIQDIIKKHYQSTFSNRTRGPAVLKYLSNSSQESGDIRLAYILSSGQEESGALNTALIKHLTPHMLKTNHFQLPTIKDAIKDQFIKPANLESYTKACVQFANTNAQLSHPYNQPTQELFFKTLYAWLNTLPDDKFKALMNSTKEQYGKAVTSFRFFSRETEVDKFLKLRIKPKIVAHIFLKGTPESTLNNTLFHNIIERMKLDYTTNPEKLNDNEHPGGPQLIMQYNPELYEALYMKLLQKHAVEPSHLQEHHSSSPTLALTN